MKSRGTPAMPFSFHDQNVIFFQEKSRLFQKILFFFEKMANRPVQNSSTMKFLNIKISQDEIDPLERKTLPMSSNSETWSTTPTFDSTSTSSGRLSISPARPVGPPSQVLPKRIREIPGAFQYQNQFDCVNPPNQSYREVHLVDIPP